MTSFFNLSRKERWAVIKDVRRRYKELCVLAPKGMLEKHAKLKVERLKEARTKELLRCQDRAAKFAQFVAVEPCTCAAELEELRAAYVDDRDYAEALRDQARVRHHVYHINWNKLFKNWRRRKRSRSRAARSWPSGFVRGAVACETACACTVSST